MKLLVVLLFAVLSFSFRPLTEKIADNSTQGYYIFVQDFADHSYRKFIVESKDSANTIFKQFLKRELELGDVQKPITIYNGDLNFYIARVIVFEKPNGKKDFRHIKYPRQDKRTKLKPVTL